MDGARWKERTRLSLRAVHQQADEVLDDVEFWFDPAAERDPGALGVARGRGDMGVNRSASRRAGYVGSTEVRARRGVDFPECLKKILIADDSSTARHVLFQMLARHGYRCILAETAREAMDKAKTENPDLICWTW